MPEHDVFGALSAEERAVAERHVAEWDGAPDFSRVLGNTEDTVWDESMVREGCICTHGQYDHDFPVLEPGKCRSGGCECRRFVRDMRGDRCGGGCVLVWHHPGDHQYKVPSGGKPGAGA